MRSIGGTLVIATVALLAAAPSEAATLHGENGTLTYVAGPGYANVAQFLQTGPAQVQFTNRADGDPVLATGTCHRMAAPPTTPIFLCDDITALVADGGDGDDEMWSHVGGFSAAISGGEGNDQMLGSKWTETLDGGPGDDQLVWGGGGNDTLIGGAGTDVGSVLSQADPPPPLSITLNDVADDGPPGGGVDVRSDVENVVASSGPAGGAGPPYGIVTIVGGPGPNTLTGFGPVHLTGGEGPDNLQGSTLDDVIDSHDESADSVTCGDGTDAALVDGQDTVSPDCETVTYAERVEPTAMTLAVRPARSARFMVTGRVVRPRTVTARRACGAGKVRITVTARSRKVVSRSARLRADCSYRRTFAVRRSARRTLRFRARYAGNAVLATAKTKAVRARARR